MKVYQILVTDNGQLLITIDNDSKSVELDEPKQIQMAIQHIIDCSEMIIENTINSTKD